MPDPTCLVCGSTGLRVRRIGVVEVDVCGACGFGRVPDSARKDDYWTRTESADVELGERYWGARLELFLRALDDVTSARAGGRAPGRLIDVGGGVGHFAEAALARGWDAFSYDVSEPAAAAAAERIGAERSLLVLPPELEGTCDLVTLWCVLAHVPDPRIVLAEARRMLKPDGLLLLTTPNFVFQTGYAAVTARLHRPIDFVAHDHFAHFTPQALDLLLAEAGFERREPAYWGITADCLLERRLATWLVPAKKLWNWGAWRLAKAGVGPYYSELHVKAGA